MRDILLYENASTGHANITLWAFQNIMTTSLIKVPAGKTARRKQPGNYNFICMDPQNQCMN